MTEPHTDAADETAAETTTTVPVPSPASMPRAARPRPPAGAPAAAPTETGSPGARTGGAPAEDPHGRVDDDGNVYVRTSTGERLVGQFPGGDKAAALAFYRGRYDGLVVEVELIEQRLRAGHVAPDDAAGIEKKLRTSISEAQAVGDLEALAARLDALLPLIAARRQERKAERAAKVAAAQDSKIAIAAEAEKIAQGSDWRQGANRMRQLLDDWKALPRIDKPTDDALWHRFSSARTTYTRRRKQHFGDLNERREAARVVKEKLADEAEALASSTDWGATARGYRELMQKWKAAGGAHKDVDDALWARFRGAQDTFFAARDAENTKLDEEFAANAVVKREILGAADKLLPVTDAKTARESFRQLADRWDAAGKVPRDQMKDLEGRFKKVEQAIRGADDDSWRQSNPEGRARAADTVAKLEQSLAGLRADLEKAEAAGNDRKAADARAGIEARQAWLDQAKQALTDFS